MYEFENYNYNANDKENAIIQYGNQIKVNKKPKMAVKVASLILSGVIFGTAFGGAFFGVGKLLNNNNNNIKTISTSNLTNVSSVNNNSNLNVTQIASVGLPSIVAITNISVQEVENYFGFFGRIGRGQVQMQETESCGSGVIIKATDSDLYVVTNYHVIEGAVTLSVTFVDDETCEAQLCGYDEENDVAVIKVSLNDLTSDTLSQISVVQMGDSDDLTVGEQVVAIGNALGYGQSVTTGIVSAVERTISDDSSSQNTYIQTDAAINPGNSGGALLNMNGELIGINTAKLSSTDIEGMGYAIPISRVNDIVEKIIM